MHTAGRKVAVALRYELGGTRLPMLVAKGHGAIAERIIDRAARHDLPIRQDADLVRVLDALDVGSEIPPAAFLAVAEILACLYRHNARLAAAEVSP
jgi:flagellar biosynthesis protein